MYKKILVGQLIVDGQRLLEALARQRFLVHQAFWYDADSERWILAIASPTVYTAGPMVTYGRIQRALNSSNPLLLTLSDIQALDSSSAEFNALRVAAFGSALGVATGPARDIHFEGVYLYGPHF